jgi:hypothetical protein
MGGRNPYVGRKEATTVRWGSPVHCRFGETCYLQRLGGFNCKAPYPRQEQSCGPIHTIMPRRWGFRMCLSHLIYTVRPCLIHTCHTMPMPYSDHAVLLKATAQHGRRKTACGLPARVRLLPAITRSSTNIVTRSIPVLLTTINTYDCKEW